MNTDNRHNPAFVVVDNNLNRLHALEQELLKRYGDDYEIIAESSPQLALERLETAKLEAKQVAILFADLWMPVMTGVEFLDRAHRIYPHAKRTLLINWGDRTSSAPLLHAMTLGWIDAYATKPIHSPDEQFHRLITSLLDNWCRLHRPAPEIVQIIGERWSARMHEMRDLLSRYAIPFGSYEADSDEGQALLASVGHPQGPFPIAILFGSQVLSNPSNQDIADVFGLNASPKTGPFDLAIIGAGPAGLSAAVYGASEGLRTVVVEREAVGGQASTSSLIRNYLGFPIGVSGQELAYRAYNQAWLFGTEFFLLRQATELQKNARDHVVILSDGTPIVSRTVVLATGAAYKRLGIPELEALVGAGVFYGGAVAEAPAMQGQHVYVAGAGNSAGQAAVHLAEYADRVTILARGGSLSAAMSDYLVTKIEATTNIDVRLRTRIVGGYGEHRLEGLVLHNIVSDTTETVPASALFILIGAQPHTDWLPATILRDKRGFILTGHDLIDKGALPPGWPLQRLPLLFETSIPGVFAVGDVRYRSVKRVASAVGEGGVVIQLVHEYLSKTTEYNRI